MASDADEFTFDCSTDTSQAKSGFSHGVADGKLDSTVNCADPNAPHPCPDLYILRPGKGFANQTTQFVNGYIKGWCSVMGPSSGVEANDDILTAASFDCDRGLSSAYPHPRDWGACKSLNVTK